MLTFFLFFFLLGAISLIAQVTILRELIFNFYGNEFFTGIILGIWLLLVALGSWLGGKFSSNLHKFKTSTSQKSLLFSILYILDNKKGLALLLILSLTLLLLQICFIKIAFIKFFPQTTAPSILSSIIFIFFALLPVCLLLGFLFPIGVSLFEQKLKNDKNIGGKAYLRETLGFAIGGLFFNFFLINSSFPLPAKFNISLMKQKFPNLVRIIYSKYGTITVTKNNGQYNFYEDGKLFTTTQQTEAAEYKIHLIFAHSHQPANILLVGNGLSQIREVLKYEDVKQIDYLELDPEMAKVAPNYLADDLQQILKDKRVKTILQDPRLFLRQTTKKYDLVIFNLPNPSTAFINRLYTKEAFEAVKNHLNFDGIFTFSINIPVDYVSEEAASFAALVNQTAASVFQSVKILPEEQEILFVNAGYDIADESEENLKIRFEERNIKTSFFSPDYLNYRLTSPQIEKVKNLLQKFSSNQVNSDFHPLAYFYQTAFWQTMYNFDLARIFKQFSLLNYSLFLLITISALIVLFIKVKNSKQLSLLSVFFIGFALMTLEILIIYSFQVTLGYVFNRIALIFALILGGMSLGNWLSSKFKIDPLKLIFYILILSTSYYLLATILIKIPSEPIFYFLSLSLGLLSGFIFPAANKIYKKTGILYAADLLGAFGGSILPSIFFVPLFGVYKTIFVLFLINLIIILIPLQKPGLYK